MNKIYILYKLEKRAETTDTLLYYASYDKGLLEEILLSIWEEAYDIIWGAGKLNPNMVEEDKRKALHLYIKQFGITEVPFI